MKTTKCILILFFFFVLSGCYASPTAINLITQDAPDRGPDICTGSEPVWISQGNLRVSGDPGNTTPLYFEDGSIDIVEGHYVTLVPLDGEAFVDLAPGDEVHLSIDWITDFSGVTVLPYERRVPNKYRFSPGRQFLNPAEWQYTFTANEAIRELALEVQPVDPTQPLTLGIYVSVSRHCSGP